MASTVSPAESWVGVHWAESAFTCPSTPSELHVKNAVIVTVTETRPPLWTESVPADRLDVVNASETSTSGVSVPPLATYDTHKAWLANGLPVDGSWEEPYMPL